ncbi:MAG: RNA recognition motif domain-containing protein [Chthoniobacterales bacterium]
MKLYVGNLTFDTTDQDLRDLFTQYGKPIEVALVTDRETGRSRGFGFVTMGNAEEGNAAIAALEGKDFQGRNLTVNEARPREDRPPGNRGGGGGRSFGGDRDRGPRRY